VSDIDLNKIVADDAAQRSAAEQAAAPVETPEVAETPEATAGPVEETAEEQPSEAEGDEPKPKKSGGGFQKRISEVTRDKHEALRRAEAAEDRERRLLALIEGKNGNQVQQPSGDEEPRQEQFSKYEDYVRAVARYDAAQAAKQVLDGHQKQASVADQEKARIERAKNFASEATVQGKTIQGFDAALEYVRSEEFPMTTAIGEYLLDADHKAAMVKYLADNPDEAFKISRLSDFAAVKELAKVEARLSAKPKPKTSSAPPPPATVSGGAAAPQTIERMDHKGVLAWVRQLDQQR